MVVNEVRAQYRDADSLLFHTVIKRIYDQLVRYKWVVRKVELIYGMVILFSGLSIATVGSSRRSGNLPMTSKKMELNYQMKRQLGLELDFITDLSPLELASKVAPLVREAVGPVKESLGVELESDIFLVLDRCEVRFVMESV